MDTWNWTDGTELAYNHSDLIQAGYKKKCTMITRNGSWRVVRCEKENVKSFICKKGDITNPVGSLLTVDRQTDNWKDSDRYRYRQTREPYETEI